jgi:hypothetical protein
MRAHEVVKPRKRNPRRAVQNLASRWQREAVEDPTKGRAHSRWNELQRKILDGLKKRPLAMIRSEVNGSWRVDRLVLEDHQSVPGRDTDVARMRADSRRLLICRWEPYPTTARPGEMNRSPSVNGVLREQAHVFWWSLTDTSTRAYRFDFRISQTDPFQGKRLNPPLPDGL